MNKDFVDGLSKCEKFVFWVSIASVSVTLLIAISVALYLVMTK